MIEHLASTDLSGAERDLAQHVDHLAREQLLPLATAWGERAETNREVVTEMAAAGLFAVTIPEEFGGQGRDLGYCLSLCLTREVLGYHSPTLDISYALQGLGTGAIVRLGDESQKARFLPDLVQGRKLFAFGLTEPDAGSDVLGMTTRARAVADGYVLDGRKMFISGAPDADVYVVFARSDDETRGRGISAFVIEKDAEGFTPRGGIDLAAPHAIGYLDLENCFVPTEARIGEDGEGLAASLGTLEIYRPSVGAFTVGAGARAWDLAHDFAADREAFGGHLIDNPIIRDKFANMWAQLAAARALVYRAARENDAGRVSGWRSGLGKLVATEVAIEVVHEAQQIHGGRGVIAGTEIEALVRAVRPAAIYEGTSEIQRQIIGREEAKCARALADGDATPPGPLVADAAGDDLRRAVETLSTCDALESAARKRLASAEADVLRDPRVRFRLADIRVSIEKLREVAGDALRLFDGDDRSAARTAIAAALLAEEARDVVSRELLQLDRVATCIDRTEVARFLAGDEGPDTGELAARLASELLGG